MRHEMSEHYEDLAEAYNENWAYSPSYAAWMSSRIAAALELRPSDRIADVGCGTGLFTFEVARALRPEHPLLCVDPSAAMLKQVPVSGDLSTLQASLEDLAAARPPLPEGHLDAVWVKEAIHHAVDPVTAVHGLARLLAPQGRLLIIMLPATIEYPLFTAALRRYEELQPDPAEIARHMSAAGLQTSISQVEHEIRLSSDRYLAMVRARYMSVLSTFTEQEIEAGITEIRRHHPEPELAFPDRFVFILGRRDGNLAQDGADHALGRMA